VQTAGDVFNTPGQLKWDAIVDAEIESVSEGVKELSPTGSKHPHMGIHMHIAGMAYSSSKPNVSLSHLQTIRD
jgi:hypothetical protein